METLRSVSCISLAEDCREMRLMMGECCMVVSRASEAVLLALSRAESASVNIWNGGREGGRKRKRDNVIRKVA